MLGTMLAHSVLADFLPVLLVVSLEVSHRPTQLWVSVLV